MGDAVGLLLLGLCCALVSAPASAGEASWPELWEAPPTRDGGGQADAALVVAIEDYAFAQDIPGAVDNGKAWVAWLRDVRQVPTVHTLVDNQATREELLVALQRVREDVRPGGTAWLIFIGHGAPSRAGDDGILVGVDAQQTALSLEARSLRRAEVLDRIDGGAQARTVVLIDACFSGRTAGGDLAPGLAPLKPVSSRVGGHATVLTAAAGDEYAGPLPGSSRPAFSYLALGALRGWGDRDGNGAVTASEVVAYAQDAMFQTVTGRTQTPSLDGDDGVLGQSGREPAPDLLAIVNGSAPTEVGGDQEVQAEIQLGARTDLAALAQAATLAAQAQDADARQAPVGAAVAETGPCAGNSAQVFCAAVLARGSAGRQASFVRDTSRQGFGCFDDRVLACLEDAGSGQGVLDAVREARQWQGAQGGGAQGR